MPPKSKEQIKAKHKYVDELIANLRKIKEGTLTQTDVDLSIISVKELLQLIYQNISELKLALQFRQKVYMLNDFTRNHLFKGLVDEGLFDTTKNTYGELVSIEDTAGDVKLINIEVDKKTRPGGGFFNI